MKFSKNLVSKETEVEDFLITSIKDLQEEIDSDKDTISKKNSLRDLSLQLGIYKRIQRKAALSGQSKYIRQWGEAIKTISELRKKELCQ